MNTAMRKLLFLLVAAIVAVSPRLDAQSERWYQIELVVFRHLNAGVVRSEVWPELPSQLDFSSVVKLLDGGSGGDIDTDITTQGSSAFRSLAQSELRLGGVYQRLANHPAYTPVLHVAWRQPGYAGAQSRDVYISDGHRSIEEFGWDPTAINPDSPAVFRGIEGTVRVSGGQLIHVIADFVGRIGDRTARVREHRQVKFKELHYFDHPEFGVVLQILPYRLDGQVIAEPD